MKYAVTTPQCVDSKYHQVDDVKKFIENVKSQHPNVVLGKVDLWILDWTKPRHVRGESIVLKDVTNDDIDTMKDVLSS